MKYRIIGCLFVSVLLCIFCFSERVDAASYTAQELYEHQIKFVAIEVAGDLWEVETIQEGNKFAGYIRKNGVLYDRREILESGMDTAYMIVQEPNKVYAYVWNGVAWGTWGYIINLPAGDLGVGLPPMEEPGEHDHLKDRIVINWPPYDGYMFSSAQQSIQYQFGFVGDDASSISIMIDGVNVWVAGKRDYKVIDGYIYGSCKDSITLNKGVNEITVYVTDGQKSLYANRMVILKQGIRDEDGDGLDDDTGEPVAPGGPDWGDGPPPLPGEGATIFDYIKWFADSVIYSLGLLVTTIKGFMTGIGQITKLFAEMFKWLPPELIAIMILGLCMTVILRVVGR